MTDQASALRSLVQRQRTLSGSPPGRCQMIAVTSGKGGVGKTSLVVNLAVALRRAGRRVAIFDADFGLANVDVFLGLVPTYHLGHVIAGVLPLKSIVMEGPEGVHIIPASSGIQELTEMGEARRQALLDQLEEILSAYDYVLIDTAAGISNNVIRFLRASRKVIVVSAPEPAAIVDAYALIKVLFRKDQGKEVLLVVNSVRDAQEAMEVFRQLNRVVENFLGRKIQLLGFVPRDERVGQAVRRQEPLLVTFPKTLVSRCFLRIAQGLLQGPGCPEKAWQGMV